MLVAASFTQRPPFMFVHIVYPVCSFQILLNCDGATYFISEYIGQAANTYFTAAWIDPRALRVQVAASFTQRPPFMYTQCVYLVCSFLDSGQLWWSHLFYFWIHWAGSKHLFHNRRSCMDRSQGSQSASRWFVFTATTFHVFLSHPAQLWWSFQILNLLDRQRTPIFHNRSCMDRSQGPPSASRKFAIY